MASVAKHGIATIFVLAGAILFYLESLTLPDAAAHLPRTLIGLCSLLAIAMFVEAVVKQRKAAPKKEDGEQPAEINRKRVFIFGSLIALYVFLINSIGYFIVTPLFVIGALAYLKATSVKNMILISAGFTVFVYLLFVMFLKIPISMGILAN